MSVEWAKPLWDGKPSYWEDSRGEDIYYKDEMDFWLAEVKDRIDGLERQNKTTGMNLCLANKTIEAIRKWFDKWDWLAGLSEFSLMDENPIDELEEILEVDA